MKEDPPSLGVSERGPGCMQQSREYWFLFSKGQRCFCIHAWTSELQGFRFSRLGWKLFPIIFLGSGSGSLESERFHLYPKSFLSFLSWGERLSLESPRKGEKAFETFQPFFSYHCSTPVFHWQCDQARDSKWATSSLRFLLAFLLIFFFEKKLFLTWYILIMIFPPSIPPHLPSHLLSVSH